MNSASPTPPISERLYDYLFEEEDARSCRDIEESACRESGHNFLVTVIALAATKLGDSLSNPKTVLAWLLTALGAPVAIIGWLVPLRESLSMLPQMAIGSWVRKREIRKWIWVGGSIAQAFCVAGMALAALFLEGLAAGIAVLVLLILFSLARGFCSIAIKDVLGKTIAKNRRGRVSGISASIAGGLTLLVGFVLVGPLRGVESVTPFVVLLTVATALWVVAALVYAQVREFAGATDGGRNGLREAFSQLGLLRSDSAFRGFVMARALFLVSALSAPYYVVLANENGSGRARDLGLFVLAGGIADMISSPVWGAFADRSSRKVMMTAAGGASVLGIAMFAIVVATPNLAEATWLFPIAFFLLSLAHAGVRAGRKTYVVDMAGGNKRTEYVAVSNSVIGAILLMTGVISSLAGAVATEWIVLALSVAGLVGVTIAAKLPEVQ